MEKSNISIILKLALIGLETSVSCMLCGLCGCEVGGDDGRGGGGVMFVVVVLVVVLVVAVEGKRSPYHSNH